MPAWEEGTYMNSNTRKHILIIGSGTREHAIAAALSRSASSPVVSCLGSSNNPGIMAICKNTEGLYQKGNITSPESALVFAEKLQAGLVVIGPEAPLAAGVPDILRGHNIPVFGPEKSLAKIETSKSYARDFLHRTLPESCPEYRVVSDIFEAEIFLLQLGDSYVIKADGLTGGKGVKVSGDHLTNLDDALIYCRELLKPENSHMVIEEKLFGEEFSLMTITDGETCIHMPAVQDHKRAYNDDLGPNTGGMGSYSDNDHSLPFLSQKDITAARQMNERVVEVLGKEHGKPYRGILYGGFMAVSKGVKIIEYNARFGDPESLNLLTLLESDAAELFAAAAQGELDKVKVVFSDKASVCKYAVPRGYPEAAEKGSPVLTAGVDKVDSAKLYLGSVDMLNGVMVTGGSRTAAVVAVGNTIAEAEITAEDAVSAIEGALFHRTDIGTAPSLEKRISHMKTLRKLS
jgi:phosphoribosylamine--glycine ligase